MNLFNRLHMNLQFFAADTGAGGGNEDPASDTTGTEETGTGEPETKPEDEKAFTQKDVNSIAAKEARKAQEKLFKEVGIEDFENAKEGLQKFKEWQDSQKTEAEKQSEALNTLKQEKDTLAKERSQLQSQISAMKAGVNGDSVEDVIALAERLVNDETTIDEAIQQVIKKYPHFSGIGTDEQEDTPTLVRRGNPNGGNNNNNNDPFAAKLAKYN